MMGRNAFFVFIVLCAFACLFIFVYSTVKVINEGDKSKKLIIFDALCKYHVYDYCAETYIDFLLKEKVSPKKILREVKKAFPDFEDDFLKRQLYAYYRRKK